MPTITEIRLWSSAILFFLHSGNFCGRWRTGVHYASSCQISSRSVKPLRRYKLLPVMAVYHLGFSHIGNSDCRWRLWFQYASSCQISSRSVNQLPKYRDLSISPKWQPSAILDLLDACSDHLRRVLRGLYRCTKFGCNRCSSLDNTTVLILYSFGLKTPIHAPKTGLWGTSDPLNW